MESILDYVDFRWGDVYDCRCCVDCLHGYGRLDTTLRIKPYCCSFLVRANVARVYTAICLASNWHITPSGGVCFRTTHELHTRRAHSHVSKCLNWKTEVGLSIISRI